MRAPGHDNVGDQTSGRIHSNPGARLLEAARELFYEQGYATAGINEIISRSGTSKKSFYNYFPGKQKLGEAYLAAEQADLFDYMDGLMERHRGDYRAFVRTWAGTLKKAAERDNYFGCPFANTAAQAGDRFDEILVVTVREWREKLQAYVRNSDLKLPAKQAETLVDMMLIQYQGAIQMWRLSGESRYFDLFEQALHSLAFITPKRGKGKSSGP